MGELSFAAIGSHERPQAFKVLAGGLQFSHSVVFICDIRVPNVIKVPKFTVGNLRNQEEPHFQSVS